MRNPLQVIPWLGLTACSALWAGYGETVTVDQRALKKLAPGWVVISERWTDRRIYEPHWPTRHELTLRDLNGAPCGATEEVTATSPIPEGWEVVRERPDEGEDGFHFSVKYEIRKVGEGPSLPSKL